MLFICIVNINEKKFLFQLLTRASRIFIPYSKGHNAKTERYKRTQGTFIFSLCSRVRPLHLCNRATMELLLHAPIEGHNNSIERVLKGHQSNSCFAEMKKQEKDAFFCDGNMTQLCWGIISAAKVDHS